MAQLEKQLEITEEDQRAAARGELALVTPTPMQLLQSAVSQNLDIDRLAKLMELQERWEKNEARKAYVKAINEFKKNPPAIIKNRHVQFGNTNYDHATLDSVCDAVIAGLAEHGISHRWKATQTGELITVTCILTHDQGYSESEATLSGTPDNSGSKNPIQAIGSAVTYLERYTLLMACGLAPKGADADGRPPSTMGDLAEKLEWIENCRTMDELHKVFAQAYRDAAAAKDANAQKALIAAKDKKKRELQ